MKIDIGCMPGVMQRVMQGVTRKSCSSAKSTAHKNF